MENTYVVISLTNGSGYSNPTVLITESSKDANDFFHQEIGDWMMSYEDLEVEVKRRSGNNMCCLFTDGEDNFGSHLLTVKKKTCIHLNCDFSDEIHIHEDTTLEEQLTEYGIKKEAELEFVEDSHVAEIVRYENEETGTYHMFIYIK